MGKLQLVEIMNGVKVINQLMLLNHLVHTIPWLWTQVVLT